MDPARSPFLLFEFHDAQGRPAPKIFRNPSQTVTARNPEEVLPALRRVQNAVDGGLYAAGFLSYEAAPAFDPAYRVVPGGTLPLLWFGLFEGPEEGPVPDAGGSFRVSPWKPTVSEEEYSAAIAAIREAIARGETYQVNYTLRFQAELRGDDYAFYRRMCAAQRAPYSAYLNLGRFRILSASPELFFRLEKSGRITARPMKGTVRRGRWKEEDEALSRRLYHSEKNRAENVMIVDLLRHDLGAVAEVGSVRVPSLFDIERYRTVFQMTSTVSARLKPGTSLEDLFRALFPCGSITGAPKVSTMNRIAALETTPREIFSGTVGWIAPGGEAVFNVAIRTAWIDTAFRTLRTGAGGGITWDSTDRDEYREVLTKTAFLTEEWPPFQLLETIKYERGTYILLDRHLKRLRDSAAYFDMPVSEETIRRLLEENRPKEDPCVVRLLVSEDGRAELQWKPMGPPPPTPCRVALSKRPVSRQDRFLYHKTTNRAIHEARRAEHPGVFDVLLWNEEGELTEFTIGNLVIEREGRLWTPRRECGLLAGTFREELLEKGILTEEVLTIDDLRRASRMWLINSVRGWVPVSFR